MRIITAEYDSHIVRHSGYGSILPQESVNAGKKIAKSFGWIGYFQDIHSLIENSVSDCAYKCSRNAMTGTVGKSKNYISLTPAEQIKVSAHNILRLKKDKTFGEAFTDIQIIWKKRFLNVPCIIIAALHLAYCKTDLFIK